MLDAERGLDRADLAAQLDAVAPEFTAGAAEFGELRPARAARVVGVGREVRDPEGADRRAARVRHHPRREARNGLVSLGRCPSPPHRRGRRRPGRPRGQPRARAAGRGPRRARARPGRAALARPLGVVLPGDAELDRSGCRAPSTTATTPTASSRRDGVVGHLERYAGRLRAPLHEGVEVRSLAPEPRGGFRLDTSDGELLAGTVVLCTGAYQRPHRPPIGGALPEGVALLGIDGYTAPGDLPPGPVLVVGSAQSGCQIAEELRRPGARSSSRAGGRPGRAGGSATAT